MRSEDRFLELLDQWDNLNRGINTSVNRYTIAEKIDELYFGDNHDTIHSLFKKRLNELCKETVSEIACSFRIVNSDSLEIVLLSLARLMKAADWDGIGQLKDVKSLQTTELRRVGGGLLNTLMRASSVSSDVINHANFFLTSGERPLVLATLLFVCNCIGGNNSKDINLNKVFMENLDNLQDHDDSSISFMAKKVKQLTTTQ